MKSTLSLTYAAFPELAKLPQAVARSRFNSLAHAFYYSADGIKASALVVCLGMIGMAAGLPFGIITSSAGAGAGILAGSLVFNLLMKKNIGAKVSEVESAARFAPSPKPSQSVRQHSFAVLTDEERAIRREKQAAYLAKRREKTRQL